MKETKDRLIYIDMIKGFSMICIIYGHLFSNNYILQCIIGCFHVPIYYIISGILIQHYQDEKRQKKLSEIIISNIKNLLVPYILFSAITIIILALQSNLDYSYIRNLTTLTLKMSGIGALWFIPTLAIAKITFYIILKNKNKAIQIIIITIMTLLFLNKAQIITNVAQLVLYRSLAGTIFLSIGYYLYKVIKKREVPVIILIIVLVICFSISLYNGPLDLYGLNNKNMAVGIILAGITSLCIILLFRKLPNSKILSIIGRNSLIILSTHQIITVNILYLVNKFKVSLTTKVIIYSFIFFIVQSLVVYICNRYFPVLIRKEAQK